MAFEHGRTHAHPQGPGEQAIAAGHGEESGGPVSTLLSLLRPQELVTGVLQREVREGWILPVGRARSTGCGRASGRELGLCSVLYAEAVTMGIPRMGHGVSRFCIGLGWGCSSGRVGGLSPEEAWTVVTRAMTFSSLPA